MVKKKLLPLDLDERKIPIKYFLQVYSQIKDFPTPYDVLFELINDVDLSLGKEKEFKSIKQTLDFSIDEEKLKEHLMILKKQKYILVIEKENKEYYKIISHPWS